MKGIKATNIILTVITLLCVAVSGWAFVQEKSMLSGLLLGGTCFFSGVSVGMSIFHLGE